MRVNYTKKRGTLTERRRAILRHGLARRKFQNIGLLRVLSSVLNDINILSMCTGSSGTERWIVKRLLVTLVSNISACWQMMLTKPLDCDDYRVGWDFFAVRTKSFLPLSVGSSNNANHEKLRLSRMPATKEQCSSLGPFLAPSWLMLMALGWLDRIADSYPGDLVAMRSFQYPVIYVGVGKVTSF
jgi:hypothetical protein